MLRFLRHRNLQCAAKKKSLPPRSLPLPHAGEAADDSRRVRDASVGTAPSSRDPVSSAWNSRVARMKRSAIRDLRHQDRRPAPRIALRFIRATFGMPANRQCQRPPPRRHQFQPHPRRDPAYRHRHVIQQGSNAPGRASGSGSGPPWPIRRRQFGANAASAFLILQKPELIQHFAVYCWNRPYDS